MNCSGTYFLSIFDEDLSLHSDDIQGWGDGIAESLSYLDSPVYWLCDSGNEFSRINVRHPSKSSNFKTEELSDFLESLSDFHGVIVIAFCASVSLVDEQFNDRISPYCVPGWGGRFATAPSLCLTIAAYAESRGACLVVDRTYQSISSRGTSTFNAKVDRYTRGEIKLIELANDLPLILQHTAVISASAMSDSQLANDILVSRSDHYKYNSWLNKTLLNNLFCDPVTGLSGDAVGVRPHDSYPVPMAYRAHAFVNCHRLENTEIPMRESNIQYRRLRESEFPRGTDFRLWEQAIRGWNQLLWTLNLFEGGDIDEDPVEKYPESLVLLSFLRICRWIAKETNEGRPLSATFLLIEDCTDANLSDIRNSFRHFGLKCKSFFSGKAVNYAFMRPTRIGLHRKQMLREIAEIAPHDEACLLVDMSTGMLRDVWSVQMYEPNRHDRLQLISGISGAVFSARPDGCVEIYADEELKLWFDRFEWNGLPFETLDFLCSDFFKEGKRAARRLVNIVASLLDENSSSILVLIDRRDAGVVVDRTKSAGEHIKGVEVTLDDPLNVLISVFSLDGAHFLASDGSIPHIRRFCILNSDGDSFRAGQSGSGGAAAKQLSKELPNSFIIKVSASGTLTIWKNGSKRNDRRVY